MEVSGRVMTLSDQLAVPDSTDLRDLLKAHNSRRRRRRRGGAAVLTLAAAIAADKTAVAGAGSGRTLLDILRDEETHVMPGPQIQDPSIQIPGSETGITTLEVILDESTDDGGSDEEIEGQPIRVSLMTLLEQSEWQGGCRGETKEDDGGEQSHVWLCCVCMVRHKGAAFIPCGHTFCRVCSRELLGRRGSCPLCNAAIVDLLDIY